MLVLKQFIVSLSVMDWGDWGRLFQILGAVSKRPVPEDLTCGAREVMIDYCYSKTVFRDQCRSELNKDYFSGSDG